jgi:hypothetical protein
LDTEGNQVSTGVGLLYDLTLGLAEIVGLDENDVPCFEKLENTKNVSWPTLSSTVNAECERFESKPLVFRKAKLARILNESL